MQTIEQLKEVKERLERLDPNNRDHLHEISNLKAREAELLRQLKEEETAEEIMHQNEERMKEQKEHVDSLMEYVQNLQMFEATIGDQLSSGMGLTEYEDQRQLFNKTLYAVVYDLQKKLIDKHNFEVALKDEKMIALNKRLSDLEIELKEEKDAHNCTMQKLAETASQLAQLEKELEESKKTQQLVPSGDVNEHLERLRKASEVKFKQEVEASYIPVTFKEPVDAFKRQFRVIMAETGEEQIISGMVQSKYRLVDEEEAARFREAKHVETAPVPNKSLDIEVEVPTFQVPDTDTIDGVAQGDVDGEVAERADQEVAERTPEERLSALEEWKKIVDEILGIEEKGAA